MLAPFRLVHPGEYKEYPEVAQNVDTLLNWAFAPVLIERLKAAPAARHRLGDEYVLRDSRTLFMVPWGASQLAHAGRSSRSSLCAHDARWCPGEGRVCSGPLLCFFLGTGAQSMSARGQ